MNNKNLRQVFDKLRAIYYQFKHHKNRVFVVTDFSSYKDIHQYIKLLVEFGLVEEVTAFYFLKPNARKGTIGYRYKLNHNLNISGDKIKRWFISSTRD